jgi:hypothetical protein
MEWTGTDTWSEAQGEKKDIVLTLNKAKNPPTRFLADLILIST